MAERLLGTYEDDGFNGDTIKVYVEISYANNRLSVVGSAYANRKAERNMISSGQNIDEARKVTTPGPGLTMDDVRGVVDVWDRWHLNDMRAGCTHQRSFGWDAMHALESRGRYTGMSEARVRAFERIGRPCPACGYRYGSAWLSEEVPADVVEFVRKFNQS